MRKYITTFAALAVIVLSACKAQVKSEGPQPTKDPVVYKGVTNDSCAVEMSFGSPGSGIDPEAFKKTMDYIKTHEFPYTSKNIGREGETRICLPLTGVKGDDKKRVVSDLTAIARSGQLVSISVR